VAAGADLLPLAGVPAVTWQNRLRVEESGWDAAGRAQWELTAPLMFESERFGTLIVPPTFRTNYASVPRLPLVFLLAGDRSHKEAALHDWLYTCHALTREESDAVFLEALLLNPKIGPGLAHTMHKAVRWFGESSWRDETTVIQHAYIRRLIREDLAQKEPAAPASF
jgi:hypothetical protein